MQSICTKLLPKRKIPHLRLTAVYRQPPLLPLDLRYGGNKKNPPLDNATGGGAGATVATLRCLDCAGLYRCFRLLVTYSRHFFVKSIDIKLNPQ